MKTASKLIVLALSCLPAASVALADTLYVASPSQAEPGLATERGLSIKGSNPEDIKLSPELKAAAVSGMNFRGLTEKGETVLDLPEKAGTGAPAVEESGARDVLTRSMRFDLRKIAEESITKIRHVTLFLNKPGKTGAQPQADGANPDKVFDADSFNGIPIVKKYKPGGFIVIGRGDFDFSAKELKELAADPRVRYVEPRFTRKLEATSKEPNDAYYQQGKLWGLKNIHAPEAWASIYASNVIVAIVDSGIDFSHPDLSGQISPDGQNFIESGPPADEDGHGTHVAGIVGATGNNGLGVVGVSWKVTLLPLKVVTGRGALIDDDTIVAAIDYALDHNAKVINCSLGAPGGNSVPLALKEAVTRALDKGAIIVAAAGNTGGNNDYQKVYPASISSDNMISVMAIDQNDAQPAYSNYGASTVDLAAPGDTILSTFKGGIYAELSGTSQAAPYVAGAVSLLLSSPYYNTATPATIRSVLVQNARPIPTLSGKNTANGTLDIAFLNTSNLTSMNAIERTSSVRALSQPRSQSPVTAVQPWQGQAAGKVVVRQISGSTLVTIRNGDTEISLDGASPELKSVLAGLPGEKVDIEQ